MAARTALYLFGSDSDTRRPILEAIATAHAWPISETYADDTAPRPALKRLQAAVMASRLDVLVVHDLSELGGGVLQVVETLAWLDAQGVRLFVVDPSLDTGTADGRRQMQLIRYLADYSASRRRELQRANRPRKPPGGARRKMPAK
jgi:DNA invertase Pin-like site-specific DNA recombinase